MQPPKVDYTINLSFIITVLAMAATGVTAWNTSSARIETLERTANSQETRIFKLEQDSIDVGKQLAEMRTDIRYIRGYVEDMKREERAHSSGAGP